MGLSIAVDDPSDLVLVTDIIHDRWFELDRIVWNRSRSIVDIPFVRERRSKGPDVSCCLRIEHVDDYEIHDSEKVGRYDFNKIVYSPEKHEILLLTGIPIVIKVSVSQLGVTLFDSPN